MIGTHLLIDWYGITPERLTDAALLGRCLTEAARACGLTPLGPPVLHVFPGGGVTGFLLLSESHIALHSYPEHGYLALDLFTCGSGDPHAALQPFRDALQPERWALTEVPRGEEDVP